MSTILLQARYLRGGVPATALTPTIIVYNSDNSTKVVDNETMTEIGDGFYKYEYTFFPQTNYIYSTDAGTDDVDSRQASGFWSSVTAITSNVRAGGGAAIIGKNGKITDDQIDKIIKKIEEKIIIPQIEIPEVQIPTQVFEDHFEAIKQVVTTLKTDQVLLEQTQKNYLKKYQESLVDLVNSFPEDQTDKIINEIQNALLHLDDKENKFLETIEKIEKTTNKDIKLSEKEVINMITKSSKALFTFIKEVSKK